MRIDLTDLTNEELINLYRKVEESTIANNTERVRLAIKFQSGKDYTDDDYESFLDVKEARGLLFNERKACRREIGHRILDGRMKVL